MSVTPITTDVIYADDGSWARQVVRGVTVSVWLTWKRIDEYQVALVGKNTVERFTLMADSLEDAVAKAGERVR